MAQTNILEHELQASNVTATETGRNGYQTDFIVGRLAEILRYINLREMDTVNPITHAE